MLCPLCKTTFTTAYRRRYDLHTTCAGCTISQIYPLSSVPTLVFKDEYAQAIQASSEDLKKLQKLWLDYDSIPWIYKRAHVLILLATLTSPRQSIALECSVSISLVNKLVVEWNKLSPEKKMDIMKYKGKGVSRKFSKQEEDILYQKARNLRQERPRPSYETIARELSTVELTISRTYVQKILQNKVKS